MYLLVWEFRVWGFRVWDNRVVLHLRSGESKVDGTGDHKLVRCPSIGVLHDTMKTLNSGSTRATKSGDSLSWVTDFGLD